MTLVYSLVLLLSISFSTVGQSNGLSNKGDKEFEARLVRVFEWVLDARFSPGQRQELSILVHRAMNANDWSDYKSFQNIAKLNDLIDAIPPEREAEKRAAIQENILKELRKQPHDPVAKLLLSVYNSARSQKVADRPSSSAPQHNDHDEHGVKLCVRDAQGASA